MSSSLGEARFYGFLILTSLVLTGKATENFGVSFIGTRSIETSHLFGCTLSWALNSLYAIGINFVDGLLCVILFVFVCAIFLFVWESVASCFTRNTVTQPTLVTYPRQTRAAWETSLKGGVYQVSPTGKKSDGIIYGNRPVTPNLTKEEQLGQPSLMIRVSIFFIRIFYGDNGKKIAVIDRTVCVRPSSPIISSSPLVEYSYSAHQFTEAPQSFLDNMGTLIKDLPDSNVLVEKARTYNAKPPSFLYRQEFEFASGHKIVKKQKMKYTLGILG